MPEKEKPLAWRGSTLDDVRAFPDLARQRAGHQLRKIQQGEQPDDWKPASFVGPGAIEVRIHAGTEHRMFVVAKFEDAIYVLHAFPKESQKISRHDIDLARRRYRELLMERQLQ